MYSSKDKTITVNGNKYPLYTGKACVDQELLFIKRILLKGFVPSYDNELQELYMDLRALSDQ